MCKVLDFYCWTVEFGRWEARAVKSYSMAELEARKLKYPTTGTESLLLGILTEGKIEQSRKCSIQNSTIAVYRPTCKFRKIVCKCCQLEHFECVVNCATPIHVSMFMGTLLQGANNLEFRQIQVLYKYEIRSMCWFGYIYDTRVGCIFMLFSS